MDQVAVKIALWDGVDWDTEVDFYRNEVGGDAKLMNLNEISADEPLFSLPNVVDSSNLSDQAVADRYLLTLDFVLYAKSTDTKIEQVLANPYKVRVYYAYIDDPTAYMDCLIDPEIDEEYAHAGKLALIHKFLNCYSPAQ